MTIKKAAGYIVIIGLFAFVVGLFAQDPDATLPWDDQPDFMDGWPMDATNPVQNISVRAMDRNQNGQQIFLPDDIITISNTANNSIQLYQMSTSTGTFVSASAQSPLIMTNLAAGMYWAISTNDRYSVCVLPDDYRSTWFWGTDTDEAINSPSSEERANNGGYRFKRTLTRSQWDSVEATKDVFTFTDYDNWLSKQATGQFQRVQLSLFDNPSWLSSDLPARSNYFSRFLIYATNVIARAVTNYPGATIHVGLHNEPSALSDIMDATTGPLPAPPDWWTGISNLYHTVVPQIRSRFPDVRIAAFQADDYHNAYAGTGTPFTNQTGGVFKYFKDAGVFDLVDDVSFYPALLRSDYRRDEITLVAADPNRTNYPPNIQIDNLRALGIDNTVHIYETYLGGQSSLGIMTRDRGISADGASSNTWFTGMNRSVKDVILYRAAGCESYIPHLMGSAGSQGASTITNNISYYGREYGYRGLRPASCAVMHTAHNIRDLVWDVIDITNQVRRVLGNRFGEVVGFIWNDEDGPSTNLAIPSGWTVSDVFGRAITNNPVELSQEVFVVRSSTSNAVRAASQEF